ncbi:uncharacterized protein TNCV_5071501 [Trichonephila clavipes]|nr:uncharacterized protein TNCV_5071501 [Trichonephila clavipes]
MLSAGVVLLHDNARQHTANRTQDLITSFGWEQLDHPPYSPDLAPSDYHLFMHLKKHLARQRHSDDDEAKATVKQWLSNQIPAQLACAYLKGQLKGRALDWFEVLGYRVIEDKATDYAHLKRHCRNNSPRSETEMSEEKLIDHVVSRLEPPQNTANLLQIVDKYEERFMNRQIRGSSERFRRSNPNENNRFNNRHRQEN